MIILFYLEGWAGFSQDVIFCYCDIKYIQRNTNGCLLLCLKKCTNEIHKSKIHIATMLQKSGTKWEKDLLS